MARNDPWSWFTLLSASVQLCGGSETSVEGKMLRCCTVLEVLSRPRASLPCLGHPGVLLDNHSSRDCWVQVLYFLCLLCGGVLVLGLINQGVQRQKSLSEQTYDALRSSILAGELLPGDRLIETQIADTLKVSRTPIREAIRQLQREELITADHNGWLRVATLSAQDAEHLYDCRIALETLAVTEACRRSDSDHLHQLEQCLTQAETAIIQPPSTALGQHMLELDYQFHRLIAESSGNPCLLGLLDHVLVK